MDKDPTVVEAAAAAWAKPKLHKAATGTVCKCGPCALILHFAAKRFDLPIETVRTAVGISNGPTPPPVPPKPRRPLTGQLGANATIVVDGKRVSAAQGLLQLATSVRDQDQK